MLNKEWKQLFSERLLQFGVRIIKLTNKLPKSSAGLAVASQLIKAATSVGANFQEAQDASSPRDFVQKLNIALREAKETIYWLRLVTMSELLPLKETEQELLEAEEIAAILISSVKSSKLRIEKHD